MRRLPIYSAVLAVMWLLALPQTATAQFGHPLKGQWSGQWGPANASVRLLLDLHWDGKAITGTVNPGPGAAAVQSVAFDYSDPSAWKVTLVAEGKDQAGRAVSIRAEGVLENIGAYAKVFHGTWTESGRTGEFYLTRN